MASISIGDAQLIVHYAVVIYRKIQNAEGEIKQAGTMMEELDGYLGWLQTIIASKSATPQDTHWNQLLDRVTQCMGKIKDASQGVREILQIFYDNANIARFVFPFGKNPGRLRGLIAEIERHKGNLSMELMSANLLPTPGAAAGGGAVAGAPAPVTISPPLPSPSPKPLKKNCGILFLDPHNLGRSKVAEAYTKLLREWTVRTGGNWPVKFAHSAGIRVKNRSDCVDVIQTLKPPIDMSAGGYSPLKIAMDSVFDNKFFNYPYKKDVEKEIAASRSRGLNSNLFSTYDYILVFMQRDFTHLLALRRALIATKGESIAPKGKGRIVHLGAYISKDGSPVSIPDAKKGEDGQHVRGEWNKTTSQIKLGVKGFLKEEMGWVQPPKGAAQS